MDDLPRFSLAGMKPNRRRGASFTAAVVGRLDARDVQAAEERAKTLELERLNSQQALFAQERSHRAAIEVITASGAAFDVRTVMLTLPADYATKIDEARLKRVAEIVEEKQKEEEVLAAELSQRVSKFGPISLRAVPSILDSADAFAAAHEQATSLLDKFASAKDSLVNALEVGRLQRQRQRLQQVLDLAQRIQSWEDRVRRVHTLMEEERFSDAVATLGARVYSTNGSPLRGNKQLFGVEPGAVTSPDSTFHVKWSADAVNEAGDDVIATAVGAEALRRWLTLSDSENPFVVDWIRKVTCRVLTTSRVLSKFACFSTDVAAPPLAPIEEEEEEDYTWADNQSTTSSSRSRIPGSNNGRLLAVDNASSITRQSSGIAPSLSTAKKAKTELDWSDDDGGASTSDPKASLRQGQPSPTSTHADPMSIALTEPVVVSLASGFAEMLTDEEIRSNETSLDRILEGLIALQFGPSNITRFFADSFQLALDFVVLQTIAETLGEDTQQSWEAIVDTLVPSELNRTVSNILAGMLALIRNARRLRDYCCTVLKSDATAPHQHLTTFHTTAVQKVMATLMAFASRVPLEAADVTETLHFFQELLDFVTDCEPLSDDRSPAATRTALTQVLKQRIETTFATNLTDALGKLLTLETFHPFTASTDDFAPLLLLMPSAVPNRGTADVSGGALGSLLDAVSCFTFASLKVCQRMMELAAAVQQCPHGAGAALGVAITLGSQYVWFVITHVAASTESVPLYEDSNVKSHIRDAAAVVAEWALRLGVPAGYPRFVDAPCNAWKPKQGDPGSLYAALERSTALTSMEAVVTCMQMCLKSVSLLLGPEALDEQTTVVQHAVTVATYATQFGFRRLATNLCGTESIANTVDRIKWDDKAIVGGDGSQLYKLVKDNFSAIQERLKSLITDTGTSKPIFRILLYVVFNISCGLIDGIVKVRKWGDGGRSAIAADCKALLKFLKASVPTVSPELVAWVVRYSTVAASPAGSNAVEELYAQYHTLYSEKQLNALAEKESFTRKRELAALLAKLNHVDKVPYSLIEQRS